VRETLGGVSGQEVTCRVWELGQGEEELKVVASGTLVLLVCLGGELALTPRLLASLA
jgi:hypothetical protein